MAGAIALVMAGAGPLAHPFAARAAAAAPPTEQLRRHVDAVLAVLRDPALSGDAREDERRAAIRRIATDLFDFEEMARRALGRHWRDLRPDEREEFVGLFTELLEQAYVSKIEQYRGERMLYLGDEVEGRYATVRTRITTDRGTEIPMSYRMLRQGGRWRAYDVVIEGVSLVANYRSQFNRIIATESYRELEERLRERLAEAR